MQVFRNVAVALLGLTGLYLYAVPTAELSFIAAELLHLAAGVLLAAWMLFGLAPLLHRESLAARSGWLLLAVGAALGIALFFTGGMRRFQPLLYAHIFVSVLGLAVLIATSLRRRLWQRPALRFAASFAAIAFISAGAWWLREVPWRREHVIKNPAMPPLAMEGEGDGPQGRFFPSSAQTKHGGLIPAEFFMRSDACQRCHADIYDQWNSSAHHFSSFNNQWYRKSVEYMQD
ncbi:MAG TPA: hypothetical protein VGQ11_06400, partial [Candidatus Acidoferrales bacterium]|nr:hypothetical protein [Candidatus Acidoferrales bacterium]